MPLTLKSILPWTAMLACSIAPPHLAAQTFSNPIRLSTPGTPLTIAVGDLTGDGVRDIVWSDGTTFHVLLQSRTGIFNAAPDFVPPTGTGAGCFIADFNKDGRGDLVCLGNALEVFLGNGDGTFQSPVATQLPPGVNYPNSYLVVPGDLNGDGIPDAIVETAAIDAVFLGDGQGGFRTAIPLAVGRGIPVAVDLNGDGKPDLFFPVGPGVALGNGDGTFQPVVDYAGASYPNATCVPHDMEMDGHFDAVCGYDEMAGATDLIVLHGYANGSFSTTPIFQKRFGAYNSNLDGLGSFQYPIAVADLNGDGTPDIMAYSDDGLAVLLGGPNLTFGAPMHYADAVIPPGLNGSIADPFYQSQVVDIDGNGTLDVVAAGPDGIYLTLGRPDGTFASAFAPEVAEAIGDATVADFNGDGIPDIVATSDTGRNLSLGRGDGTFAPPVPLPVDGYSANFSDGYLAHGDIDGTGFQDVLFSGSLGSGFATVYNTYYQTGGGNGTFSSVNEAELPGSSIVWNSSGYAYSPSPIVDINRDGMDDFVGMENLPPKFQIVSDLAIGNGSFREVSTQVPYYYDPFNPFLAGGITGNTGIALADFNGLGVLDAAYGSVAFLAVVHGKGDGSFYQRTPPIPVPTNGMMGVNVEAVAAGDFDGDGNQDVAALVEYVYSPGQYGTPTGFLPSVAQAWVYYGNGDGTFSAPVLAATFDRIPPDDYPSVMALASHKGSRADLIFYRRNGSGVGSAIGIAVSQPSRTWSPVATYTPGMSLTGLRAADVNGDGYQDLVAANGFGGSSATILVNSGPPNAVTGVLTSSPATSDVGQPIALTATLLPPAGSAPLSGTVTFGADGVTVGTAPLHGNSATIAGPSNLPAGFDLLTATWSGDSAHSEIGFTGIQTVNKLPVKVVVSGLPKGTSEPGQIITFSVVVTPIDPPGEAFSTEPFQGTLTLYDVTTVSNIQTETVIGVQTNPAGTYTFTYGPVLDELHTITAYYSGDQYYAPGQGTYPQNVAILTTAIQFSAAPNPVTAGLGVTLTAHLTSPGTCTTCPYTALVEFSDEGKSLGSVYADADGTATLSTVIPNGGSQMLLASYPGDGEHLPGAALYDEKVLAADTSLTLTAAPDTAPGGTPVAFTAHVVPAAGAPNLAGATVDFNLGPNVFARGVTDAKGDAIGSSATLPVGVDTVSARLEPNATLNPSSASVAVTITRAVTAIALSASPNPVYQRSLLALTAALSTPPGFPASGTVQLLDGGTLIGTPQLVNNVATFDTSFLVLGPHTITAVYAGDANTLPIASAPLVVTVLLSSFSLSSAPAAITIQTEHHLTFDVSAQSIGNFTDQLQFSADLLPPHMTVEFASQGSLDLAVGGDSAMSVYLDTSDVLGYARATPMEKPGKHTPGPLWAFLPAPLPLLLLRGRCRRGNLALAGVGAVLLAGLLIPLSGCSGMYPKSTAPGVYTIQIHAVGAQTGVAQTLTLQVTVTP